MNKLLTNLDQSILKQQLHRLLQERQHPGVVDPQAPEQALLHRAHLGTDKQLSAEAGPSSPPVRPGVVDPEAPEQALLHRAHLGTDKRLSAAAGPSSPPVHRPPGVTPVLASCVTSGDRWWQMETGTILLL